MGSRRWFRWVLPIVLLAFAGLGAERCDREPNPKRLLEKLFLLVKEHSERIAGLEECVCCCEGIFQPVCTAGGRRTFVNACEAHCAGAEIIARGPCVPEQCGGPGGIPCPEGQFCELPPGCDDPMTFGRCEEQPRLCLEFFAPVCGCDGETYGNDCERRRAGVPLDHEGRCEEPPVPCRMNADCAEHEYCRTEPGACPDAGVCTPRTQVCPAVVVPVCGCDGRTYENACTAALAGVSVAHDGPCRDEPRGCESNDDCGEREFCRKPDGACDGPGLCASRPEGCPEIFAPVCGCDGHTYGNLCEAFAAGVSVAHDGPCRQGPPPCTSNADCGARKFCRRPLGVCEGPGHCARRPDACILLFDPVCGCDGQTHGNACAAALAGVGVAHDGPCGR